MSQHSPHSSAVGPPAPRGATLAICSDLDETPDAETYFELMRFLNTTEETSMGPGVGLEIGNSIYFDMLPGHFSYWNTTEANRDKIRELIRSGHIDVLHSYGDLATTRAHAARALDELTKHNCYLKVWVDHAQAATNFGTDIMQGHGDELGHPAYHADLTLGYGIQYVWRGRVTSVIGQNQPFSLRDLASGLWSQISPPSPPSNSLAHPMGEGSRVRANLGERGEGWGEVLPPSVLRPPSSALACTRTFAKECAKQLASRCGSRKYQLHAPNSVLAPCSLRDGREVIEFLRCNPHPGGVSCGDRGDRIHEVLTREFLNRLVQRSGACILYTHLGKLDRGADRRRFSPAIVAAFRLLADYHRSGKLMVTTTRRLLDYLSAGNVGADTQFSTINQQQPRGAVLCH